MKPPETRTGILVRTDVRPGDLGAVVGLHGRLYATEYGFDETFEAYVAGPLADMVLRRSPRERIWLAERGHAIVGSVAIVAAADDVAQLRWFVVDPSARGAGLGRTLIDRAIGFAAQAGYRSIVLQTVGALTAAAHLYVRAGFRRVDAQSHRLWGVDVVEERYERALP